MSNRQKIHRSITFDMGRGYHIKVGDILNSKLLRPDDTIEEVFKKLTVETYFKSNSEDGEHYHVVLRITRFDDETDEEYSDRIKREERQKQEKEQKDHDENIRLKAKFEP